MCIKLKKLLELFCGSRYSGHDFETRSGHTRDALIKVLDDKNWKVRVSAAKMLAGEGIEYVNVREHLLRAFTGRTEEVRIAVIDSLGEAFGYPGIKRFLIEALNDENEKVRQSAVKTLSIKKMDLDRP